MRFIFDPSSNKHYPVDSRQGRELLKAQQRPKNPFIKSSFFHDSPGILNTTLTLPLLPRGVKSVLHTHEPFLATCTSGCFVLKGHTHCFHYNMHFNQLSTMEPFDHASTVNNQLSFLSRDKGLEIGGNSTKKLRVFKNSYLHCFKNQSLLTSTKSHCQLFQDFQANYFTKYSLPDRMTPIDQSFLTESTFFLLAQSGQILLGDSRRGKKFDTFSTNNNQYGGRSFLIRFPFLFTAGLGGSLKVSDIRNISTGDLFSSPPLFNELTIPKLLMFQDSLVLSPIDSLSTLCDSNSFIFPNSFSSNLFVSKVYEFFGRIIGCFEGDQYSPFFITQKDGVVSVLH
ncbi:hypothetical protein P9112_012382 [Eukaryota sp. TZLM1-RC]